MSEKISLDSSGQKYILRKVSSAGMLTAALTTWKEEEAITPPL